MGDQRVHVLHLASEAYCLSVAMAVGPLMAVKPPMRAKGKSSQALNMVLGLRCT